MRRQGAEDRPSLKDRLGIAPTLVAFATALVALVLTLFPGLKPDPHENFDAKVSVFAVEGPVTRHEWIARLQSTDTGNSIQNVGNDKAAQASGDDCNTGYVVYVVTVSHGFTHNSLRLRAWLYDALGRRIDPDIAPRATVPIKAPSARSVQPIWIFGKADGGRERVHVELTYNKQLLDVANSAPFRAYRLEDADRARADAGCT